MGTMRAFVRRDGSSGDVVEADVPAPEPGPDEVLVAVAAFGVGIHDRYFIPGDARFPYVIGTEAAGVVAATGSGVPDVARGDRVMLTSVLNPKGGTWAELAAVAARSLVPLPAGLDLTTAAGIPIAGDAAIECLHTLDLSPGDALFVAGASGAIGTLLVQMATARGVRVAASASARNQDYLRGLGAELAVDYGDPGWQQRVRDQWPGGVDAALAIQPGTGVASQFVVREGGRVVTVSGDPFEPERDLRVEQFAHRDDIRDELAELAAAIAAGRIRLVLERVYAFADAVAALEKTETRHARGKLVVTVDAAADG